MSLGKKPNRFLESAKQRREGALEDPHAGGITRIDVEGAVVYEGEKPITVEVFGVTLSIGEDRIVRAKNATFQLVKLEGRDCLVPIP